MRNLIEDLEREVRELTTRNLLLRKVVHASWLDQHVGRCEQRFAGVVLLNRSVLSGANAKQCHAQLFTDVLWSSVIQVMTLTTSTDLVRQLAAIRELSGEYWNARAVARSTEVYAVNSEHIAKRLLKAWELRDERQQSVKRLVEMVKNERQYTWT